MPSGFLILADGRCLARRWRAHDLVLRAIADAMEHSPEGTVLRDWLQSQLPGPADEEEIGFGAWLREAEGQIVVRHLDIRELTPTNQRLFRDAALEALRRLSESSDSFPYARQESRTRVVAPDRKKGRPC